MFKKEAEKYATKLCCTYCKAVICKEKCELLGIIQGKDKVIQELKKELNSILISKNQQL